MAAVAKKTPKQKRKSKVDSPFRNFTPYKRRKTEAYMNDKQVAHFRSILEKWRLELMVSQFPQKVMQCPEIIRS